MTDAFVRTIGKQSSESNIACIVIACIELCMAAFCVGCTGQTYRRVRWLHDGRAKTLERLLTEYHSPDKVSGTAPLTEDQVQSLVAYLKSL